MAFLDHLTSRVRFIRCLYLSELPRVGLPLHFECMGKIYSAKSVTYLHGRVTVIYKDVTGLSEIRINGTYIHLIN